MLIEIPVDRQKISQKYIIVLVSYGGQQDASTSKVSIWSANQQCHTTLQDSQTVNSKVKPKSQRLTQTATAARSTLKSQSQRFALGIVLENAD